MMIEGEPRGALSWAFARAIEGAADRNGDGAITQQELLAYLVPTVEIHAHNQQTPSLLPLAPAPRALISIGEGTERLLSLVSPAENLVTVAIRGDVEPPDIAGVRFTATDADADFIWDVAEGWVEHRVGGRVAEAVGQDEIGEVLSKWVALAFLENIAIRDPLTIGVIDGNETHIRGERLTIAMSGGARRYLTLFNLPPDGRVELLAPINVAEAEEDWRDRRMTMEVEVADPPFGAEHIVAILTDERPAALQSALRAMAHAADDSGLAALLLELLAGTEAQVSILGIHTAAE